MKNKIIDSIDLNYIIAESSLYKYNIKILSKNISIDLPYNYDIAYNIILNFIQNNKNNLIVINITSNDFFPLNRNIILQSNL